MVPAMAVNGVAIALIGFVFADSLALSSQSMLYILASGIVLAVSFSLITIAPQYIPAPEVAMFFPLGTVLGTLLAWIIVKEQPSSNALIGGSIVIVTIFCHAWYMQFNHKKICAWCKSNKIKFINGREGIWKWKYSNKEGSRDKRRKDNIEQAPYISVYMCLKCNAETRFLHEASKSPSRKNNILKRQLLEDGEGKRKGSDYGV